MAFAACSLGVALFAGMDAAVKLVSIAIGVYSALLWRSAAGALLGGGLMLALRRPWPDRRALGLHILRGVVVSLMAYCFFWALMRLPLAEGIALSFVAPLIALYLAALMLGERVTRRAVVASVIGLAGVGVILIGKLGAMQHGPDALWGVAAVLFSAVLYAGNLILQRKQAQLSSPVDIAFFQHLIMFLIFLVAAPWHLVWPPADQWPMILLSAVLAFVSLALIAWAYARAEAQRLIPVEYSAFVWSVLAGWLVFGESLTPWTFSGSMLIIAGSLLAVWGNTNIAHVESSTV